MGKGFETRQKIILESIHHSPEVKISQLVEQTGAAIATVRRDLLEMERRNLLVRTFGGARAVDEQSLVARTFEERRRHACEAKEQIARKAQELVSPGMSIVIDSGTTCWTLARHLKEKAPLHIVTSALAVIEELGNVKDIEINLVGGRFRVENLDFYGPASIRAFAQFHVDLAFLSCDGLLPAKGAFSHDLESAAISQAMIESATTHVLLCDATKVGRASEYLILPQSQIDVLVTDRGMPELNGHGYRVLTADSCAP